MTTQVAIVSDTHLSAATPEAGANWDAVVRHIEATGPDLVVHLGDTSLDGAHQPADLEFARSQLDRLPVAWRAIPGNHDVGDNPWNGILDGEAINAERHTRWVDLFGSDWWSLSIGGWNVIAINAQLFGARLDAAEAQWAWLVDVIAAGLNGPVLLLAHKPWAAPAAEIAAAPPYRFVPAEGRALFDDLVGSLRPALVVSGHVHQHRELHLSGTRHVWAPTTWAVLSDAVQPTLGNKRCGLLSLGLDSDGQATAEAVEPDGIHQHTLGRDVPDPYMLDSQTPHLSDAFRRLTMAASRLPGTAAAG
jgi:3',5'-cyclic AMP phosphodiesterase CpdA